ncbi:wax ester/triacylglycerol synthase family O-acyltransferase [Mycobacterium sp.]|uniref:wax ester/triacylglycerol synthase family O-acyltransferase n=1 Tax=Mycobacterium sp. TaxID=1785 RepID=UPI002CFAB754|nr:wax ester/triacylglycerol synthase family O-acyltransferase [Mycobacterium sp.]HME46575.1 wax ester/triacylglycerol synthase family O-acyltransferase [Mycobacterium sp.]
MTRLALVDTAFFALESPTRPSHAGVLMLFDPPKGETGPDFAHRVVDTFRATAPVAPFDRRPALGLGRLPHWVTVDDIDLGYHVRAVALPAPGSRQQLMEMVEHLYVALLDRSRPLWECYVIEGLEGGQVALFYKLHHALADGISGARMLFGSLSESPDDSTIAPLWGPQEKTRRRAHPARRPSPVDRLKIARRQAETMVGVGRRLAGIVPEAIGLRRGARALPFSAPRLASATMRQSPARSFAIFDLPLSEVKRVGERAGGSINDVVLTVCDHAMQRYLTEQGDPVARPLIASMAVSTRGAEDDKPSNAAALAQVQLGAPDATPAQRLEQVVASTATLKAGVRGMAPGVLELESVVFLGAAQLREELPMWRGVVPQAANMLVSNIPGGPKDALYMSGGRLASLYAAPIVPPAHALNITLASYAGTLCFGVGASRNVIPDTARIAELALQSFDELARSPVRHIPTTPA